MLALPRLMYVCLSRTVVRPSKGTGIGTNSLGSIHCSAEHPAAAAAAAGALSQSASAAAMQAGLARVCCRRQVVVQASYSFAESARVKPPQVGRRNRVLEKRQEQELRTIVHGLCTFNTKQLAAVSHLLTQEVLREVRIATGIPPTNQGRRRQEGLVAKLLRSSLGSGELAKLAQAVEAASRDNLPFTDTDVEAQLDCWMEGLLANEQEVVDEVHQLLAASSLDWQQLRSWVRQVQQDLQQRQQQRQEQQTAAVALQQQQQQQQQPGSTAVDASQQPQAAPLDPEVQALMQELAQQQRGGKQKGKGGASSSATVARRSIRRMLKPFALARVQSSP